MTPDCRVIFTGKLLDGFDPELVREKATRRLKASAEQIEKLFAGRPAVLKRGLSAEQAEQYRQTLARIGMEIEVECSAPAAAAPAAAPAAVQIATEDMEKTLVAGPDALRRYMEELPPAQPEPTPAAHAPTQPAPVAEPTPVPLAVAAPASVAAAPVAEPEAPAAVAGENLALAFREQADQAEAQKPAFARFNQRQLRMAGILAVVALLALWYMLA